MRAVYTLYIAIRRILNYQLRREYMFREASFDATQLIYTLRPVEMRHEFSKSLRAVGFRSWHDGSPPKVTFYLPYTKIREVKKHLR